MSRPSDFFPENLERIKIPLDPLQRGVFYALQIKRLENNTNSVKQLRISSIVLPRVRSMQETKSFEGQSGDDKIFKSIFYFESA